MCWTNIRSAFLPPSGHQPYRKRSGNGMPSWRVVQRERRIGDHPVEAHQLAALGVQRVGERVVVADVGVGDAVQQHVHLGDGPDAAVLLLAAQARGSAGSPPCSSTYSLERISMPPEPEHGS